MSLDNASLEESHLLQKINRDNIPEHVAFIMDGNGRWAQKRNLLRNEGHKQGVETLRQVVSSSNDLGFKIVTFYAFSTENWKRPSSEVYFLLNLPEMYLEKNLPELMENNVHITVIGDLEILPEATRAPIEKALEKTRENTGMILNLAINYGGRAEILMAARKLAEKANRGELNPDNIDEKIFEEQLYTSGFRDPDLLVRTSGEQRISNFLLWQLAYTELWYTSVYWPEFTRRHLIQAVLEYQRRQRRYGGIHT